MSTQSTSNSASQAPRFQDTINNILFPTDFSETADHAFLHALRLSVSLEAKLVLYHVYYDAPVAEGVVPEGIMEAMRAEKVEDALAHFRDYEVRAKKFLKEGVVIEPRVEGGYVTDRIIEASKKLEAGLIVMGTMGQHSDSESILGSITSRIINHVACPILAIPESASTKPFQHLLFATGFGSEEIPMIEEMNDLSDVLNAKLSCIHVSRGDVPYSELEPSMLERIMHIKEHEKVSIYTVNNPDIVGGLRHFISRNEVDMLIIAARPKDVVNETMRETLTAQLVLHSEVPLLVYHLS
ncbi:universal stress protein [Pontibacter sp. G13]|uniref:universal stress protein n=1 Tax=Pontibacter sp. G13 TaxID=3074898 RepID=UPI0028891B7A|nr:universal stress protein [Pontibacter sp. G13]WNJ16087.1 universal stress protein [Pontibacter sp. G13]